MEDRATEVLAALKNANLSIEAKAATLTKLKSDIKQKNVPPEAISPVFDAVRLAILSPHTSLSTTGFSSLAHLLKRLYLQQQHNEVSYQGHQFYPLLLERLGDHKERIRTHASQAFTDFWIAAAPDVEQHVLGTALLSKNPRAKQASMLWLARMTREHGLRFRAHLSKLVACLEDADSGVRETAKSTVIELFQNVPSKALSDLKKQLQVHNVRKSIVSSIMSTLGANGLDVDMSRSEIIRPTSSFSTRREELNRPTSVLSMRSYSNGDGSNQSRMDTSFQSQAPSAKTEPQRKETPTLLHAASNESFPPMNDATEQESLEPLYVNSQREFEDIIHNMVPYFEGKESEQNWSLREKSVIKLRRITNGNAPHDYQYLYVSSMKALLDGILKTVNSLRTTVSTAGCNLIQDMARTCGPAIDNMVEILLQQLIKLCAALKKITAQSGNVTVDAIIGNVSYTSRIMQHMWAACQDKNVQPRLFLTGWLKTIINKHGSHKSAIEHGGGLDLMEKCIKKGLADPNPGVRESMRGTYWVFARVWPDKAEGIISSLDPKSRTLLERDAGNPNRDQISQSSGTTRPRLGATTPGRSTLKETIRAQKRAGLNSSRSIPTRPESAHSSYTDVRATKPTAHRPHLTTSSTTRTVPTGASLSYSQGGSLSSAPMRPSGRSRRPELVRPATADPYSRRNAHSSSVHSKAASPAPSPRRTRTKSVAATPARPKSRIGEAPRSTMRSKSMRSDEAGGLPLREALSVADIDGERANAFATNIRAPSTPTRANSAAPVSYAASPKSMAMSPTIATRTGRIVASPAREMSASLLELHSPSSPVQRAIYNGGVPSVPVSPASRSRSVSEELEQTVLSPRHSTNDSDCSGIKTASPVEQRDMPPNLHGSNEPHPSGGLQVYEDPQSPSDIKEVAISIENTQSASISPGTPVKSTPLEERALNEPATLGNRKHNQVPETPKLQPSATPMVPTTDATHRRWRKVEGSERKRSLSPRSKDPVRASDMIDRGLNKIRAGAIDVHGYRKFQSLLRYHDSIVDDESKYSEILLALLETLASPDGDKPTGRSMDLKTQVLVTIRLLLALNRQHFSKYYAQAMTAIITARKLYGSTNHFVSGLEETSEDIVSACNPPEVIGAVLDLLEKEKKTLDGCRMVPMGTYILSGLVGRLNDRNMILTDTELQHLGSFARQNLRNPQPDVRRAVIEFCLELHDMVKPEEVFWSMISSPGEDVRPLLTYYIMRKSART